MKSFFLVLLFTFSSTGNLSADGDWITYVSTHFGYAISYPGNSEIFTLKEGEPASVIHSHSITLKDKYGDTMMGGVVIEVYEKSGKQPLISWVNSGAETTGELSAPSDSNIGEKSYSDYIKKKGYTKFKHVHGYQVITYRDYPGDPNAEQVSIYIDGGRKIFKIFFQRDLKESKREEKQWALIEEIRNKIINSFRLLNKKGKK